LNLACALNNSAQNPIIANKIPTNVDVNNVIIDKCPIVAPNENIIRQITQSLNILQVELKNILKEELIILKNDDHFNEAEKINIFGELKTKYTDSYKSINDIELILCDTHCLSITNSRSYLYTNINEVKMPHHDVDIFDIINI
jgi:exonuclease I